MKDTSTYKELLEAEQKTLEGQLGTVGRRNPSNPADWEAVQSDTDPEADPNDVASHIENYEENTAILKDLEIRYNLVLGALARIQDGTYGICSVGGEEIEEDRLNADPAASTCKAHLNA